MESSFSPGLPVTADIDAIERELRAMWESPAQHEGKGAFIRACAGNLVALASSRDAASVLLEVLPAVAQQHPLRSLLACHEETPEPAGGKGSVPIRAWINAQCSAPVAGGPQVCSETITFATTGAGIDAMTNLLASALIPDLPVYLYLPRFTPPLGTVVHRLATWASLLILDSHCSGYRPASEPGLMQLVSSPPAGVPVRDLEWSRLTIWRDLVSQFFDAAETRALPYGISRVEIEADAPDAGAPSSAALLLAGWLASRLDWSPQSAVRDGDRILLRCTSAGGEVLVALQAACTQHERPAGMKSTVLYTRAGRTFAVQRDVRSSCLAVAGIGGDTPEIRRAVPGEAPGEANLLVRELSIAGQDPGFQQALSHAIRISGLLQ